MNSSHLHIKFAAIVKPPFRPHLRLAKSKTGAPKPSVGSPEVTPESGAFKHVGIRQRPSLQLSRRAAGPSYLHARRFRCRSASDGISSWAISATAGSMYSTDRQRSSVEAA